MANLARRRREWEPDQLFRMDPFRTFRDLLRWDPFGDVDVSPRAGEAMFVPDVELKECPDQLVLKADLPGMREEDIDVSIVGNRLTISGRREEEKRREEEQYFAYERQYGSFSRSFVLPETYDQDRVQAEMKDGVLTVTVPKRPGAQARHIPVGSKGREEGPSLSAGQGGRQGQGQISGQGQSASQGQTTSQGQPGVQGRSTGQGQSNIQSEGARGGTSRGA